MTLAIPPLKLAVTPGDPAGIGLDVLVMLAQSQLAHQLVAFCDVSCLVQRAKMLELPLQVVEYDESLPAMAQPAGTLTVCHVECVNPVIAGKADPGNATYVLACLDQAIGACLNHELAALITGSVNKHMINQGLSADAGADFFSGHTEYIAKKTATDDVVMMLAVENPVALARPLRVALVTTHLPLRDVADAVDEARITRCVEIIRADFARVYGLANPVISVCGLNPHAGESGDLGEEEKTLINPCLDALRKRGFRVSEALPADTLFTPHILDRTDVVLAMYHDQGLAPLKSHGFGRAVNITLGLPIIRCSVDHGTAYDIAGSGAADASSLRHAMESAEQMATALASSTITT